MSNPNKAPKVSVIVPNYNHAPYIQARLASILAQGFKDYELIVLDDASTDTSVDIIKERLSGQPHRLIENQVNSGSPCLQWQRGVEASSGELIWIAESDDTCTDDFLERCVERFTENTILVYTRTQAINDEGQKTSSDHFWPDEIDPQRWRRDFEALAAEELKLFLTQRNTLPNASSVLFRRPDPAHLHDACRLRYSGDWIFWATLLASHPESSMTYLASPLTFHRHHQTTTRFFAGDVSSEMRRFREYSFSLHTIRRLAGLSRRSFLSIGLRGGWDWMHVTYLERRSHFSGMSRYSPPFRAEVLLAFWLRLVLDPFLGMAYFSPMNYRPASLVLRQLRLSWNTHIARFKHALKSHM